MRPSRPNSNLYIYICICIAHYIREESNRGHPICYSQDPGPSAADCKTLGRKGCKTLLSTPRGPSRGQLGPSGGPLGPSRGGGAH